VARRPDRPPAVRLLLDEQLSPTVAERLRGLGHDVETIRGTPHEGPSDRQILDLARSQGRALVTNNLRDFRPLHHLAIAPHGSGHPGMVFVPGNYPRAKTDTGRLVRTLKAKLAQFSGDDDLANGETWL